MKFYKIDDKISALIEQKNSEVEEKIFFDAYYVLNVIEIDCELLYYLLVELSRINVC